MSFDNKEIKFIVSDGREFTISWFELIRVSIQTTDEGPARPDAFWLLETKKHTLRIPHGTQGDKELLHQLQKLPGFDNQTFISSMASVNNNLFVCWEKK